MPVNEADLQRLGIDPAEWAAHQRRFAVEPALEVRCVGGKQALMDALSAAGVSYLIIDRTPEGWASCPT